MSRNAGVDGVGGPGTSVTDRALRVRAAHLDNQSPLLHRPPHQATRVHRCRPHRPITTDQEVELASPMHWRGPIARSVTDVPGPPTPAAISDFYTRTGLGPPDVARLDLPQRAPRALSAKDTTRWLRAVERWLNPRDRVAALIPFYAGLRIGETVALNTTDVQLSARKGKIIVRSGKGKRYREVPLHAVLREQLALWINDERPGCPGATDSPALLLNRRGGRLTAKGGTDILAAIAADAVIPDDFSPHVLRHCFGTTLGYGQDERKRGHELIVGDEDSSGGRASTYRITGHYPVA